MCCHSAASYYLWFGHTSMLLVLKLPPCLHLNVALANFILLSNLTAVDIKLAFMTSADFVVFFT